jgi:transposase-like protein
MSRRKFTTVFKNAVAKLVTEQGYTQKNAAENLGVDPASISRLRHSPPWMF